MLLHELRHVEADQALLAAEQELSQGPGDFRFTDARGAEEQERTGGARAGFEAGAGTADGAGEHGDRFILADDALVQLFFNAEQLGDFLFLDRRHRDAGPARDDVFDIVLGDDAGGGVVEVVLLAELAHVFALFTLFIGVEARLLELMVRDGIFHAMNDELDALLNIGQIAGQRGGAQFHARTGFVDQIDGLIRQEAIRDVAAGSIDGGFDRFIGIADRMELLVAVLDAEENLDGVGFAGRRNFHGLEAAFEGTILFNGLAELGRSGGADALNFAA